MGTEISHKLEERGNRRHDGDAQQEPRRSSGDAYPRGEGGSLRERAGNLQMRAVRELGGVDVQRQRAVPGVRVQDSIQDAVEEGDAIRGAVVAAYCIEMMKVVDRWGAR